MKTEEVMMDSNVYVVATTKQWNLKIYNEKIRYQKITQIPA